jgi:hypothetical protein
MCCGWFFFKSPQKAPGYRLFLIDYGKIQKKTQHALFTTQTL